MPPIRDRHCSACGTAYPEPLRYPRKCLNAACGMEVWANPIPVGVVLLPVIDGGRTGLLVLRRGIEPRKGFLALVGGFLEEHETWQQGSAREMREEVGVTIDPATLALFDAVSTEPRPNRILMFSTAPSVPREALAAFVPSHESTERGVVFGPDGLDEVCAFPLHAKAARRWFATQNITGPHDFTAM